jgi:hypothetical protein
VAGGGWSDGQGTFWGDLVGPNPTDRAKVGVKRSLLVEATGGPLSVVIAGANVPDFKLLEATLDAIVVGRPEPTEQAPQHLCLDKGYDKQPAREVCSSVTATSPTSGVSARRRKMMRARNAIRRDDGWWSELWAGSRSVEPSWCATTRRLRTTWG